MKISRTVGYEFVRADCVESTGDSRYRGYRVMFWGSRYTALKDSYQGYPTFWFADSLRKEISDINTQLEFCKDTLLGYLNKLTENSENVLKELQTIKNKDSAQQQECDRCKMVDALDKQNGLLRDLVHDKEDEVSSLEKKIREMELAGKRSQSLRYLCLTSICIQIQATNT